jgi:hypothetical protein
MRDFPACCGEDVEGDSEDLGRCYDLHGDVLDSVRGAFSAVHGALVEEEFSLRLRERWCGSLEDEGQAGEGVAGGAAFAELAGMALSDFFRGEGEESVELFEPAGVSGLG